MRHTGLAPAAPSTRRASAGRVGYLASRPRRRTDHSITNVGASLCRVRQATPHTHVTACPLGSRVQLSAHLSARSARWPGVRLSRWPPRTSSRDRRPMPGRRARGLPDAQRPSRTGSSAASSRTGPRSRPGARARRQSECRPVGAASRSAHQPGRPAPTTARCSPAPGRRRRLRSSRPVHAGVRLRREPVLARRREWRQGAASGPRRRSRRATPRCSGVLSSYGADTPKHPKASWFPRYAALTGNLRSTP